MKEREGIAGRRRDAQAMRRALLDAALEVFAEHGYDNAGLRDIARVAGGDARLIGRYFGSKEGLFAEVVDAAYEKATLMTADAAPEMARTLLNGGSGRQFQALLLTLRSASNARATNIMRDSLERHYQSDLAAALDGPDAVGRAALLISICAGVQLQRDVLQNTALTNRTAGRLAPYLEAALRAIAAPVDSPNASGPSV